MGIMEKSKMNLVSMVSLGGAIFCFSLSLLLKTNKPPLNISKQDSSSTINTTFLKTFSLGNRRFISDIVWIQTLLESDLEHYKKKDLNNWMYLRFNQISDLDPYFYENYLYGGLYLSVVKDDPIAASLIYDKGLKYYPDNYKLLFNAGFNGYFELGDSQLGLKYLERIQNHHELPVTMRSIIAKLKFQTTLDYDLAFEMVSEHFKNTQDEYVREKLRSDLYAIKAEKDLNCLNHNKKNCSLVDLDGKAYVYRNGMYQSLKPFNSFRVKLK